MMTWLEQQLQSLWSLAALGALVVGLIAALVGALIVSDEFIGVFFILGALAGGSLVRVARSVQLSSSSSN